MSICRETILVIEKYAKNGSKHENGPNWAGSRVQALRLTRRSPLRRYARMRRDASHPAASRVTPDIDGTRQAIRLGLGSSRKAHKILSPPSPLLALVEERFQELKKLLNQYLNTFEALEGRS
ncbi:hypothetical protein E3N88_19360 [Mikania micrantha]|uniref:Uncharacterized protein n=1 Tax=Mikania micrantha TaxID=192012 RepID=A0A5N6NNG3_9ASTR|nr:hypothetical protein E3N88_19360 [Mikania micrantha]